MYENMMRSLTHIQEIAQFLVTRLDHGCLLDVGTGHGLLLAEIHRLNPTIELFGLDISPNMISLAQKNLAGSNADIRLGNIHDAPYEADFFDLVTCTGSFYLWNNPQEDLDEVYRILKPGHAAFLFETHREYDPRVIKLQLKENLRGVGFLKRKLMATMFKKQLKMTYSVEDITEIVRQTRFAQDFLIEKISLARLPVWQRVQLTK